MFEKGHKTEAGPFRYEEAWPGGPLRKIGSGDGKPSKYVCHDCRTIVGGVYLKKTPAGQPDEWVCAKCRPAA